MTLFSLGKIFSSHSPAPLTPVTPTHIYSVTIVYSDPTRVRLKFNIDIHRLQDKHGYESIFNINRSEVLINEKPASNALAGDLAARCGSVIYPLQIQVSDTGDIINIWNYKAITQRWATQEKELHLYFTGEAADEYIAATAATINDPELFRQSIQQDLFLTTYFRLLYTGFRKEQRVAYPLHPFSAPILFDIKQERTPKGDELHQRGQCENGDMEIKAAFTSTRSFLRIIEARWANLSKEVALRAVCLTDDDEPLKPVQHG